MIKIPYVLDYTIFEKINLSEAEELLSEYNDFMGFNKTQVQKIDIAVDDGIIDKEAGEQAIQRAEHNRKVALDHFEKLFGSKDIAESSLVGLRIDYDSIQKVLLEERAKKTPITESEFNYIAPTIRAASSVLLFAESIVSGLEKLGEDGKHHDKIKPAIEFAKQGFELLLDGVAKGSREIQEYDKSKRELHKIKTVDGYIAFCEKLFFENRDS